MEGLSLLTIFGEKLITKLLTTGGAKLFRKLISRMVPFEEKNITINDLRYSIAIFTDAVSLKLSFSVANQSYYEINLIALGIQFELGGRKFYHADKMVNTLIKHGSKYNFNNEFFINRDSLDLISHYINRNLNGEVYLNMYNNHINGPLNINKNNHVESVIINQYTRSFYS